MRTKNDRSEPATERPRFYQVSEVAVMFGVSPMTIYRAINDNKFPAVRIRSRYVVPARALDEMVDAALSTNGVADAADWVSLDVA